MRTFSSSSFFIRSHSLINSDCGSQRSKSDPNHGSVEEGKSKHRNVKIEEEKKRIILKIFFGLIVLSQIVKLKNKVRGR